MESMPGSWCKGLDVVLQSKTCPTPITHTYHHIRSCQQADPATCTTQWAAATFRLMLRAEATSLETPPEPLRRTSMLPRQARCRCAVEGDVLTAAPAGRLLLTARTIRWARAGMPT